MAIPTNQTTPELVRQLKELQSVNQGLRERARRLDIDLQKHETITAEVRKQHERQVSALQRRIVENEKIVDELQSSVSQLRRILAKVMQSRVWRIVYRVYRWRPEHTDYQQSDSTKDADVNMIVDSGLFDEDYYIAQCKKIGVQPSEPIKHFLLTGAARGLNPSALFDTSFYLSRYPDVAAAGTNPLVHYLRYGAKENRQILKMSDAHEYNAPVAWPWYSVHRPVVSIIIIAHNKSEFTIECLKSIWSHTTGVSFEVLLIDNGSASSELDRVRPYLGPARLITANHNTGFGEGNNIAAEYARGDYIMFLNNDVTVTQHWLERLVQTICDQPNAGAVGAKLVYPDGRLQEAGAMIRKDGTARQRGKGSNPNTPEYNVCEPVDYCSAASLLIRRDLFLHVRGFDACYDPAYYEDVDLCFKIENLGFKTYYCPDVTINHFEGATSRDAKLDLKLNNIVEVNRQKFLARWHQRVINGPSVHVTPRLPARPTHPIVPRQGPKKMSTKKRVGVFTPYGVSTGGGERYILSILAALESHADVEIIAPEPISMMRVGSVAAALGVPLTNIKTATLAEAQNNEPYDLFFALGNSASPLILPLGKRNIYICQFPFPAETKKTESAITRLSHYDRVVVYSDFVRSNVRRRAALLGYTAEIPIEIISPPVAAVPNTGVPKEKTILHVGRFFVGEHNKKQLELVQIFKRMVDAGTLQGWKLILAGAARPEPKHRAYIMRVIREAQGYPISVCVEPPTAELHVLYNQATVYWHATGLDEPVDKFPEKQEHFGITTVEAMSAGCIPVVIATGGQPEIVQDKIHGFLWRTENDLRESTVYVTQLSPAEQERLQASARARAANFSQEVFARRILGLFADLVQS